MRTGRSAKCEVVSYDESDKQTCSLCGAFAVVPLTSSQIAKQPDETTHVCHPAFGGCNHGFEQTFRIVAA